MKKLVPLGLLVALTLAGGCATAPYRLGDNNLENRTTYRLKPGEPQIVRGRPHGFLDASDWIWPGSLLSKLVLWNWKVDRHYISPETEAALRAYLDDNHLMNVKVRLNAYSVGDEWRRTMRNKSIGAGWRYTMGFLAWLGYTIMPGRFFGGDHYNPYSNTINLYSDVIPITLHEAGHSKDFARRKWKGTYAVVYAFLPLFNLYPEALATSDALSYSLAKEDRRQLKAGYKILYPAYGTYLGGGAGNWLAFPWNYAAYAGGVIPGHIVGRIKAARIHDDAPAAAQASVTTPSATAAPSRVTAH